VGIGAFQIVYNRIFLQKMSSFPYSLPVHTEVSTIVTSYNDRTKIDRDEVIVR